MKFGHAAPRRATIAPTGSPPVPLGASLRMRRPGAASGVQLPLADGGFQGIAEGQIGACRGLRDAQLDPQPGDDFADAERLWPPASSPGPHGAPANPDHSEGPPETGAPGAHQGGRGGGDPQAQLSKAGERWSLHGDRQGGRGAASSPSSSLAEDASFMIYARDGRRRPGRSVFISGMKGRMMARARTPRLRGRILKSPEDMEKLKVGEGGWATFPMKVVYTGKNPLPHRCGCGVRFLTQGGLAVHRKVCSE